MTMADFACYCNCVERRVADEWSSVSMSWACGTCATFYLFLFQTDWQTTINKRKIIVTRTHFQLFSVDLFLNAAERDYNANGERECVWRKTTIKQLIRLIENEIERKKITKLITCRPVPQRHDQTNTFSICNAIGLDNWIEQVGRCHGSCDTIGFVTKDSPIDWKCSKTEWKVQGNRHLSLIFACVPCTSSMHDDTVHRHNNNKFVGSIANSSSLTLFTLVIVIVVEFNFVVMRRIRICSFIVALRRSRHISSIEFIVVCPNVFHFLFINIYTTNSIVYRSVQCFENNYKFARMTTNETQREREYENETEMKRTRYESENVIADDSGRCLWVEQNANAHSTCS